jgi:hypothetical protein
LEKCHYKNLSWIYATATLSYFYICHFLHLKEYPLRNYLYFNVYFSINHTTPMHKIGDQQQAWNRRKNSNKKGRIEAHDWPASEDRTAPSPGVGSEVLVEAFDGKSPYSTRRWPG